MKQATGSRQQAAAERLRPPGVSEVDPYGQHDVLHAFVGVICMCLPLALAAVACRAQVGPAHGPAVTGHVEASANVASPTAVVAPAMTVDQATSTSQPADQDAARDQSAGRDNKPVAVQLNMSGSGWPIATTAACLLLAALGLLYIRQRWKYAGQQANSRAVASAIEDVGPGPVRDRLLSLIEPRLFDRRQWDKTIKPFAVKRRRASQK